MKTALTPLYLWLQRQPWRPKPPLLRAAKAVLGGALPDTELAESWDTKLDRLTPLRAPSSTPQQQPRISCTRADPRPLVGDGLRVLVATPYLGAGGLDEVAAFLARRLPTLGLDSEVLHVPTGGAGTAPIAGRIHKELTDEGVPIHRVEDERGIRAALQRLRPDVVSAHGPSDGLLRAAADSGVPVIETLHGMHEWYAADRRATEPKRSQLVHSFVAVSDLVRKEYLGVNPTFPRERVVTIPNSVETRKAASIDRELARSALGLGDEFLFVSLARYGLQKNAFGLLSAFAEVQRRSPSATLLLAGPTEDRVYLRHLLRLRDALGMGTDAHLRCEFHDTGLLYAAADCLVLDSFFEGWALAPMEALCSGVPVVLSEVGGAREQVGASPVCGQMVKNPAGDPIGLSWQKMRAMAFREQHNRDELAEAMRAQIARRRQQGEARTSLREMSLARFDPILSLRGHAVILTMAADRPSVGSL